MTKRAKEKRRAQKAKPQQTEEKSEWANRKEQHKKVNESKYSGKSKPALRMRANDKKKQKAKNHK